MESFVKSYGKLFESAHHESPIQLVGRAIRGQKLAQIRVTHSSFDHMARAILYLKGSKSVKFLPRNMGKEINVLSRMQDFLSGLDGAAASADASHASHLFFAPSLDNGSMDQTDEAAALSWLLGQERIYKYVQLQILLSLFGKYARYFSLISSVKQSISDPRSLSELYDMLRDVDLYVICTEDLVGDVLHCAFADSVRAITALPSQKPLHGLFDGHVGDFAAEVVARAQEMQNNRPLIIISQSQQMNAAIAAQLLASPMSHVALIDIGRALEILVGDHKTSAGIYTRSTGHVGKFTYLLPVSPEKWRASRERIQA